MDKIITIAGFGNITVKQAFAEITYHASTMQAAYKRGHFNIAMESMRTMRPFVAALQNQGYTIKQILGE